MKRTILAAALCLCLSSASVGAALAQYAPPPVAVPATSTDYGTLRALSAALTPAQRAQAQSLFATSFSLWKSGDFAAAEIGFKQGLDIDPANALANFYYGDCLARRKAKTEAKIYLARAVAFGGMTAEGLKAQAELQTISAAPTDVRSMDSTEIAQALIGEWKVTETCSYGSDRVNLKISQIDTVQGSFNAEIGGCRFESGRIHADEVRFACTRMGTNHISYQGNLVSPSQMSGTYIQDSGSCRWSAEKQ